jgi:hypothetical protein
MLGKVKAHAQLMPTWPPPGSSCFLSVLSYRMGLGRGGIKFAESELVSNWLQVGGAFAQASR